MCFKENMEMVKRINWKSSYPVFLPKKIQSHNMLGVTVLKNGDWVCPYNPHHLVRPLRFQIHLVKCRQKQALVEVEYFTCPYNAKHIVPMPESHIHLANCSEKASNTIHITHCEEILRKRKHGDINTPGPLVSKSLYEAFCEGEDAEEEVGRRQDVVTYDFAPRQTERVERTTTYRKGMFKDITDEDLEDLMVDHCERVVSQHRAQAVQWDDRYIDHFDHDSTGLTCQVSLGGCSSVSQEYTEESTSSQEGEQLTARPIQIYDNRCRDEFDNARKPGRIQEERPTVARGRAHLLRMALNSRKPLNNY
ncbi:hypothetical protein QYM36_004411 [Artemia franciscana]|uniref:CHHC U11-48K-type domain-containing protein n=2 Tax=Artemia franciscana TaxID=6661 RepID=A0AA88I091_ARTSF|nr:hypothetical protein QYM36_004411 [Artemia franciscana]